MGTRSARRSATCASVPTQGYDRIVFEFEKGIPALDVKVGKPPFTKDPSGLPLRGRG